MSNYFVKYRPLTIVFVLVFTLGLLGAILLIIDQPQPAMAQGGGSELIQNGDFSSGLTGWSATNVSSYDDNGNLVAHFTTPNSSTLSQEIQDVPETGIYRLSFNCVSKSTNDWTYINYTIDPAHSTITSTLGDRNSCRRYASPPVYDSHSIDLLLLENEDYTLTFDNDVWTEAEIYLDNVSLQKVADVDDLNTGIVNNGEFIGPYGWTHTDAVHRMEIGPSGTQLGAVYMDVGGSVVQETSTVAETGIYRLSFSCMSTSKNYWTKISYLLESDNPLIAPVDGHTYNSAIKCPNSQAGWQSHSFDQLLLAGEAYTLTLYHDYGSFPLYLDNISLVKVSNADDLNTGIITNGEFIGPDGWSYLTATHRMEIGPSGTQLGAAFLTDMPYDFDGSISQTFTVPTTATYSLAFDCKSASGNWTRIQYKFQSSNPNTPPIEPTYMSCQSYWSSYSYGHVLFPDQTYTLTFFMPGWPDISVFVDNISLIDPNAETTTEYPLLDRMLWSASPECPFCGAQSAVGWGGGPINTRNGNLSYQETDLAIPVLGGNISFRRSYASQTTGVYTTLLGHGWTHNYDMRLHFSGNELPDTVELQASGGSRLPFFCSSTCITHQEVFTPYAGVTAQLSRITATSPITTQYILTSFNQMTYTFNHAGMLVQQADAAGNTITFTHSITNGKLLKAAQSGRYLLYRYDANDRLIKVEDHTGRAVELQYDTPNGDLVKEIFVGINNSLRLTTTYEYNGSTHLLTKVTDPSGRVVEETFYDTEGRAIRQLDGAGDVVVELDFTITNTHVMTENGVVFTHTYDSQGTLVENTFGCKELIAGCQSSRGANYDYNFKTDEIVDPNNNPTSLDWNAGGSNLEGVIDALGNSTSLNYDSFNNLTEVVNARSHTTTYTYDNADFPTFRTAVTDALEHATIYTPTTIALDGVDGLLKAQRDPNGVVISYTYNTFGQVIQMVHGYDTADAVTTTYGYDSVGRLITITQTSALESHTSLNVYDDANRLIATIGNWTGSDPTQWLNNCDTSSGERDTNVCTRYKYDDAGRPISTTNTLNQTNLTFYDDAGRVVTTVVNYDGTTAFSQLCTSFADPDPEYNICSLTGYDEFGRVVTTTNSLGHKSVTEYNALGRVSRTIQNYVDGVFNASEPDTDVQTLYEYDNVGNTIIITDTLGRMNRTFYDELNRVVASVSNWQGEQNSTITSIADLNNCLILSENQDYDLCTLYKYDEVGNTIIITDSLGRMNRTFYDELNRAVGSVANWRGEGSSSTINSIATLSNCFTLPENRDYDICTLYGYDDAGNQITVTNALNQTSLTIYDEANRAVIQVSNWDGTTTITADGTGCADTAANPTAEENLCTDTGFDQLGRRKAYTDTMGLLTTFTYDGLNRLVTTTRYLGSKPANTVTSYDALGNRLAQTDALTHTTTYEYDSLNRVKVTTSPEGVAITQTYNAAGWVITTTNSLGNETVNEYDDLGRLISTTDAELNKTQYVYDALGNQTAMIDAEGVKTTYVYDGLNRLVKVIENDVASPSNGDEEDVTTEYVYDSIGNRVMITNANGISFTQTVYDGLYRPVVITDAIDNATHYVYDALGSRVVMTDGNNEVTQYTYDDLNRLRVTTYLADSETVTYRYDAAGNRLVMTDTLGVTTYVYDGFYRLITVTNPFNEEVQYKYDLAGNRINLIYPDSKVVTYTHDMDNRLTQLEDWDDGLTTYGYDPAGRLVTTTLPNGAVTVNSYDDANRLTSLAHADEYGLPLASFSYDLDKVGNRIVTTETMRVVSPVLTLTLGTQFTTTTDTDDQRLVDVAYNPADTEYMAVWQDDRSGNNDLYGRTIDADGTIISDTIALATGTPNQTDPHIAYSPAGDRYLLVWAYKTGSDWDVFGRLLKSNGQPTGDTITIANSETLDSVNPDVVYDANSGHFLVVWSEGNGNGSIKARSVETTGDMGSIFIVAESTGLVPNKDAPAIAADGTGGFLVAWQDDEGANADILAQRVSITTTVGSVITLTSDSANEDQPALAYHAGSDQYLALWSDLDGSARRIMARFVLGDGTLSGSEFLFDNPGGNLDLWPEALALTDGFLVAVHREATTFDVRIGTVTLNEEPENVQYLSNASSHQLRVALAGEGASAVALWETKEGGDYDIVGKQVTMSLNLQTTTIAYTYDPLYRLTNAAYTGALSATYEYLYDAVSNRTAYTANITSTEVITYEYDNANRLIESVVIGGDTTTYTWDNASRLITTTVAGQVSRVYDYSQDGDLITATVDGLTTTFTYDGDGRRLQMSVAGEVTTYTLDYAFPGFRILFEDGPDDDKHYLYGVQCIGEVVDEGTSEEEWRYYQRDGNNMVRQTTNTTAKVTLAWTYTPQGMVLVGEEGPVTYLDCGTGGIYDWSTGLIFKDGRFFDPSTGVWLVLGGSVLLVGFRRRGKTFRKGRTGWLLLAILLLSVALSSCERPITGTESEPSGDCPPDEVPTTVPRVFDPKTEYYLEEARLTPTGTPLVNFIRNTTDVNVRISWDLPENGANSPGRFAVICCRGHIQFIDANIPSAELHSNYYKVEDSFKDLGARFVGIFAHELFHVLQDDYTGKYEDASPAEVGADIIELKVATEYLALLQGVEEYDYWSSSLLDSGEPINKTFCDYDPETWSGTVYEEYDFLNPIDRQLAESLLELPSPSAPVTCIETT